MTTRDKSPLYESYFAFPLDPECPFALGAHDPFRLDALLDGEDIAQLRHAWENRHRKSCERCAEYGLANVSVFTVRRPG